METKDSGNKVIPKRKRSPDLVIEGGTVLTMVGMQEPIEDATVFVAEGEITAILQGRQDLSNCTAETIDATGALVMPGLVNAHTHAAMTLFRGLADDLPLRQWLHEKIFPAEAAFLSPETVYYGALLACAEMIASGTTSFVDGYFFQDETVRAVHQSGLRAHIAQGVIDFPAPGVTDPKDRLKVARNFLIKWLGFSELITPGVFCHSPVTCSERTLKEAWEISREFNLPLQIHLSETRDEVTEIIEKFGKRPVHYLDRLGLIDRDLIAAHAVYVDESEIELLAEKGVKVVHAPESNMKLASGVCPVSKMIKKGLTVGLGTDGCSSNNNLDLFLEMDTAAKLAKVFDRDPTSLDATTVLKMATAGGAAVLGRAEEIGTLDVGKKADIVVIDLDSPHLCPIYNPMSALVYSASGADVRDVIVQGRVLMKNREFMTLDPEEIMQRVKALGRKIGGLEYPGGELK